MLDAPVDRKSSIVRESLEPVQLEEQVEGALEDELADTCTKSGQIHRHRSRCSWSGSKWARGSTAAPLPC